MGYKKYYNVIKAVREWTIKAVDAGHFRWKHQDDNSTISTTATNSTNKRSTYNKGGTVTVVKKDNGKEEEDEEEDLPLSTYEEYLHENGVISLNVGESNRVFEGDRVSEFGIGYVQVADVVEPTTTRGALFADAGEWKVKGRGGSCPNKSSLVTEMVSKDSAGSTGGTRAAPDENPTWMDNL